MERQLHALVHCSIIQKVWCIYTHAETMENYSIKRKKEILLFEETRMELGSIGKVRVKQRKTNTVLFHLHLESKNYTRSQYNKLSHGYIGASLVAQQERIHLPMQETQGGSLGREDPTNRRELSPCDTKIEPVLWRPRAATTEALEPLFHDKRSQHRQK